MRPFGIHRVDDDKRSTATQEGGIRGCPRWVWQRRNMASAS